MKTSKLEELQLKLRWVQINLEHWEYAEDKAKTEAVKLRLERNKLKQEIIKLQKE